MADTVNPSADAASNATMILGFFIAYSPIPVGEPCLGPSTSLLETQSEPSLNGPGCTLEQCVLSMPNVFLEIYLELGKLGRGWEFAHRGNQPYSPNTQIIHLTAILV
jgi:hypothetical protein